MRRTLPLVARAALLICSRLSPVRAGRRTVAEQLAKAEQQREYEALKKREEARRLEADRLEMVER